VIVRCLSVNIGIEWLLEDITEDQGTECLVVSLIVYVDS
jgi:hypothetical protein